MAKIFSELTCGGEASTKEHVKAMADPDNPRFQMIGAATFAEYLEEQAQALPDEDYDSEGEGKASDGGSFPAGPLEWQVNSLPHRDRLDGSVERTSDHESGLADMPPELCLEIYRYLVCHEVNDRTVPSPNHLAVMRQCRQVTFALAHADGSTGPHLSMPCWHADPIRKDAILNLRKAVNCKRNAPDGRLCSIHVDSLEAMQFVKPFLGILQDGPGHHCCSGRGYMYDYPRSSRTSGSAGASAPASAASPSRAASSTEGLPGS